MKNLIKLFVLLCLGCNPSFEICAQAKDWKETDKSSFLIAFEQMNNWHKLHKEYSMKLKHATFDDYSTIIPSDISSGYFIKSNRNYHSFLLGIHTIQNDRFKIVIDSSGKDLFLSYPNTSIWTEYDSASWSMNLDECISLKMDESQGGKTFRMEFSEDNELSAYEFTLAKDGRLLQSICFYKEIQSENEDGKPISTKPRLTISYFDFKFSVSDKTKTEFNELKYIAKSGDNFIPSSKYKEYNLIDQRVRMN